MPNGDDPDVLSVVGQLVDDAVGTDAQRAEASQSASERVSRFRSPLEEPESLVHRLGHMPLEVEDLPPSPPSENEAGHLRMASSRKFPAEVPKRDRISALHFA